MMRSRATRIVTDAATMTRQVTDTYKAYTEEIDSQEIMTGLSNGKVAVIGGIQRAGDDKKSQM